MNLENVLDNEIPIRAWELPDMNYVGEFPSITKAARSLFIRNPGSINQHIFGRVRGSAIGKKHGIKSYKTDKKYYFERVKDKI